MTERERVLAVACPSCEAPAGSSCGFVIGRRRGKPCPERVEAAQAAAADEHRRDLERA